MKKILYVVTKSNLGGAQKYVLEASEAMKKAGFDVAVACGGKGILTENLAEKDITTFDIAGAQRDISIFKEITSLFSLAHIILKFKPDILHLNSPKIGGIGSILGRLLRVRKIIYTNHGWPFNEDRPLWQKFLIKILSYKTILFCHKVILLSKKELDMVSTWIIPYKKDKFVLIPIGVQAFDTINKEDARTILLGNSKAQTISDAVKADRASFHVFGTIGELTKNKGYPYVLKALKKLADEGIKFVYIVIGEGEELEKLEKITSDLGIEDRVFFLGRIEQAKRYLSAFDFFILGSIKEGLPYVLVEAGFSQIPIISTNVGGIPELIENMREGLVVYPKRPEEIYQAITYMLSHQERASEFTNNLYEKVSHHYSFDVVTLKLKQLYIG